jgi:hypothetical protein
MSSSSERGENAGLGGASAHVRATSSCLHELRLLSTFASSCFPSLPGTARAAIFYWMCTVPQSCLPTAYYALLRPAAPSRCGQRCPIGHKSGHGLFSDGCPRGAVISTGIKSDRSSLWMRHHCPRFPTFYKIPPDMHFPRILQHRPSPRAFDDLEGAQAAAAELTRALDAIYSATSGVPTEALCTQLVAFLESIAALDGRTVKRELDAFADLVDRVILALARGQDQPGRYRRHWDECLTMCVFFVVASQHLCVHAGASQLRLRGAQDGAQAQRGVRARGAQGLHVLARGQAAAGLGAGRARRGCAVRGRTRSERRGPNADAHTDSGSGGCWPRARCSATGRTGRTCR